MFESHCQKRCDLSLPLSDFGNESMLTSLEALLILNLLKRLYWKTMILGVLNNLPNARHVCACNYGGAFFNWHPFVSIVGRLLMMIQTNCLGLDLLVASLGLTFQLFMIW
ncbi:uncharacterized protein LOC132277593 isoform X2 [Cornus florida]|uniref:uncharacterized protein LOC132277593 isoform X2 n=1 Tax=Cornus florida TaxID=4283 RepID=UPI00289B53C2|nr:uncharacterized protein LOC132277593 isoform X2 [Cornus florida]